MGSYSCKTEVTSSIPPAKAFKAVVSANNLISSALMPVLKSAVVVEEITSSEGNRRKMVEHKVEAPDNENFSYCYSIMEGDALANTLEKTSYEVKVTASPEGGSVCKNESMYFIEGDGQITEEKIMPVKEKASALFKAIEACLVPYPETGESVSG